MSDECAEPAQHETPAWSGPAAEVASNTVTFLAGLAGPEAGGMAAAASPVVKHAFDSISERWHRRSRRSGEAVPEAADEAGLPPLEVAGRAGEDPRLLALAGAALNAGMGTADPDKVRALGRALASAFDDEARVDLEVLTVAALTDMEAPHVKVLRRMKEARSATYVRTSGPCRTPLYAWPMADLQRLVPEAGDALGPVLATLGRHHLIEKHDRTAEAIQDLERKRRQRTVSSESIARVGDPELRPLPPAWVVTTFGEHVLELLATAAVDD